ncbi:MAG: thiol-disulfide oxidoreductase DCC family protein [Myxococcales bacterium]|nr:thiol-disulfide oxidoreductase DCC family protein [Myxococcales bacterium]
MSEAAASDTEAVTGPVVLFDGVCSLCQGSVQFLIARDAAARLRFASLQSEPGRALLRAHGVTPPEGDPDSILLVSEGRVYDRSDAILRIAGFLPHIWSLGRALLFVPRGLRDRVYKWVARNRYRWFGKTEVCWMPTPELKKRFLK